MIKVKKKPLELPEVDYHKVVVSCACGAEYDAGSTSESIS